MTQEITVPKMWTLKQAEVETPLKRPTLIHLVKTGKIKYIRLGAGKRGEILINAKSLCDYMAGGAEL